LNPSFLLRVGFFCFFPLFVTSEIPDATDGYKISDVKMDFLLYNTTLLNHLENGFMLAWDCKPHLQRGSDPQLLGVYVCLLLRID
jgi:hypothetical protein